MAYTEDQLAAQKKLKQARLTWSRKAQESQEATGKALAQSGNISTKLDEESHRLWLEVGEAAAAYEKLARETANFAWPSSHVPVEQPGNPPPILYKNEKYQGA